MMWFWRLYSTLIEWKLCMKQRSWESEPVNLRARSFLKEISVFSMLPKRWSSGFLGCCWETSSPTSFLRQAVSRHFACRSETGSHTFTPVSHRDWSGVCVWRRETRRCEFLTKALCVFSFFSQMFLVRLECVKSAKSLCRLQGSLPKRFPSLPDLNDIALCLFTTRIPLQCRLCSRLLS